nr:hypothetical protein [Tanacetum cinerariifolium]
MATTIGQQVALDEALVPNVPEIYMQEFRATTTVHQHSIRFKMDTRKHIVDLESFREMLHISPRVPGQSFAELPFEEEILEFPLIPRRNRVNWHYVRDGILFSTIKVAYKEYYTCATGAAAPKPKASARKKKGGSASSTTPPTLIVTPTPTTTVVAAPRLSAAAKGKQPARATSPTDPSDVERTEAEQLKIVLRRSRHETHISQQGGSSTDERTVVVAPRLSAAAKSKQPARATTPTEPTDVERTEAEQLKIVLKRSRQETHISQQCGSGTDEGTGSRPGVPDVPSDDSEEELSWNSFDDEDVDEQTRGRKESEGNKTDESDNGSDDGNDDDNDETIKAGSESDKYDDDNDDEEELAKNDDEDTESDKGGNEVSESDGESDEEEIRQAEEESFDPIPRTPEESEDESSNEEDQELRLSEEARIQKEEEADELGGIHFHDGIFSDCISSNTNTYNDSSIIATITISRDAPIPPTTIPSIILENLPTFNSAFRFDERLRSLETTFSEYRQTNPFVDAVSAISVVAAPRLSVTAKAGSDKDDDENGDEEELAKIDDKDTESGKGSDEVSESERESDEEETRQEEEESFDQ